jgi:hypothetical protein
MTHAAASVDVADHTNALAAAAAAAGGTLARVKLGRDSVR